MFINVYIWNMKNEILQGVIGSDIELSNIEGKGGVLINSPGGSLYVGYSMYDYVLSNNIDVGVCGVCGSAATMLICASPTAWGTPNSRYLIHNPSSEVYGNYDDITLKANELKQEQNKVLSIYEKHLNGTREEIQVWMNESKLWDAETALQRGLIKEIKNIGSESNVTPQGADIDNIYNNFKMSFSMNDESSKELSLIRKGIDKIQALISPKMAILQDVNGMELDFVSDVDNEDQVAVGSAATVSGEPAEGEYVMPSGVTFVFAGGAVTEIIPASQADGEEVEALKSENETLQAEAVEMKATIEALTNDRDGTIAKYDLMTTEFKSVKDRFAEFQNNFSLEVDEPKKTPIKKEEKKNKFTYKK